MRELLAQSGGDALDALVGLADGSVLGEGDMLGGVIEADTREVALVGAARRSCRGSASVAKQHRLELLADLEPSAHRVLARTRQVADGLVLRVGDDHRGEIARAQVARERERVAPIGLDALAGLARGLGDAR